MSNRTTTMTALCALAASIGWSTVCAQTIRTGDRYVALGSSYAAGPGVGRKDPQDAGCARSLDNYARQLAARRGLHLIDASCSGATTDDVLTVAQTSNGKVVNAPQIEAVTPDTAMVTVTIGGNDVDYVKNLFGKSCLAERAGGDPKQCHVTAADKVAERFAALPGKLDAVVQAIRRRAPRARIVFVNYLPVLPSTGGCAGVPIGPADAAAMVRTYQKLATVEQERAAANGVGFVAAGRLGAGHDACSADPYTTTYHPPASPGWQAGVGYHPTPAGMTAIADALDKLLGTR